MAETEVISIIDFISENWEKFDAFEKDFEKEYIEIIRKLPPEFHQEIRDKIFKILISITPFLSDKNPKSLLKLKLVIDANIIVQDAFRVAKGKESSTERIFSSPYLELVAPDTIEKEVMREIRKDLPRRASLRKAQAHAKKLLSHVNKISSRSLRKIKYAFSLIGEHSPEDIPYLALSVEYNADAIVSRDKKAFDRQTEVKRWELGEAVKAVVIYESGCFSLVVLGTSAKMIGEALVQLLIVLLEALVTALKIIGYILTAIVEKSIEALSRIPDWAWAIIGVGVVVLLASIFCEDFRNWIGNIASKVSAFVSSIIEIGEILWEGIKSVLILLWNLIVPIVSSMLIIAGVLCRQVYQMLRGELTRINSKLT